MSFLLGRLQLVQAGVLLVVGLLFALLTLWAMESVWQDRAEDILNDFRVSDREIMGEFLSNLDHLNDVPELQPCSDEMLRLLRITEYRSRYWHEYAYVENGQLLCSTSLGVLVTPLAEPQPDFQNNQFSFTRHAPVPLLDGSVTAMRMQQGNFRALLRPLNNPADGVSWLSFGTFTVQENIYRHIYGDADFYPKQLIMEKEVALTEYQSRRDFQSAGSSEAEVADWYEQGYWVAQLCLRPQACGVVSVNLVAFFTAEKEMTTAILICFIVILFLTTILTSLLYQRHFSLNRQLKRGIRHGRIVCHYQPIIPVNPRDPFGCEVLCRWIDESGSLVYPDRFIPDVESNGQSALLTEIVFLTAVDELERAGLLGRIRFSINAFPEDIENGVLLRLIRQLLPGEYHSTVIVELTEKEINNMELLSQGIRELRSLGVKVAIDDFGTGYSNLNHLKQLHVDSIKIDKSFVWGLDEGMVHAGLVQNIVYIAESLGLDTVAEGVETKDQLQLLTELDVQYIQGYYFAKPMPLNQFVNYLQRKRERIERSIDQIAV